MHTTKRMDQLLRPRLGDIIEIAVGAQWAYAQYAFNHRAAPRYGHLLSVRAGLHDAQLSTATDALSLPEAFYAFTHLPEALRAWGYRIVARVSVNAEWTREPVFRTKAFRPGMPRGWKIWRPTGHTMSDLPDHELSLLPELSMWTPGFLTQRIAEGWQPSVDPL